VDAGIAAEAAGLFTLTVMRGARTSRPVIATPGEAFAGVISLDDLLSELLTANPH